VSKAELLEVKSLLHSINAFAELIECQQSRVPMDKLMDMNAFSMERFQEAIAEYDMGDDVEEVCTEASCTDDHHEHGQHGHSQHGHDQHGHDQHGHDQQEQHEQDRPPPWATAKDAGNIFGGIAVLMFIPLYAAPLIISDPQGPVAQLFTYFPYSAPVTALLRNAFESLAGWEAAIVVTELFLLSALVLQIAVRLFRTGSIQYNSRVSLKTIFARSKALKATQP